MSLSGTRGLMRISQNPTCEFQAAMVADRVKNEPVFFRQVTGRDYEGEFGERVAARQRGAKFEANLHQNNAALLRNALAPLYGWEAEEMVVRNFADELPGPSTGIRAQRLHRMRLILRDLAEGREVPHLLIQPQLVLPIGPERSDVEYISPDFMVLDSRTGIYRPGEEKSFIIRDGVADRADLDGTRRQAAAQILGLQAEARRVGLEPRVDTRAVFVFATAYGLSPAKPFEEALTAEMREIRRAAAVLLAARRKLKLLRTTDPAPLPMLFEELATDFRESCIGTCVMADECQRWHAATARTLGDDASDLLGPDFPLDRVVALLRGDPPETPREVGVAATLTRALDVLPGLRDDLVRRTA
jgi:hypothetical protein